MTGHEVARVKRFLYNFQLQLTCTCPVNMSHHSSHSSKDFLVSSSAPVNSLVLVQLTCPVIEVTRVKRFLYHCQLQLTYPCPGNMSRHRSHSSKEVLVSLSAPVNLSLSR